LVPGVLAEGAWPAWGDFGVVLVPEEADEEPPLAPVVSLSFFILLCFTRLCFAGLAVSLAVVLSVLAPPLALGLLVFESTLALVDAPAVAFLSVRTDEESAANTLKEIAARLLKATGRNLRILVSMERMPGDSCNMRA
jgi:hypothetical protein